MDWNYYFYLYPAYAVAFVGWFLLAKRFKLWESDANISFAKPWLEFLLAFVAVGLTLAIGQLYIRGWLLPASGNLSFLTESLNQIAIFSPFALLLLIRGHSLQSAWMPKEKRLLSIGLGLGLAFLAIATFLLTSGRVEQLPEVFTSVYSIKNLPHLVQVFAEDFAIAVLFVRFQKMVGLRVAIAVVAILFAAGHIPAMIADGITGAGFFSLIFDTALGIAALSMLAKSQNMLWFWMVHFAMDMMQFVQ